MKFTIDDRPAVLGSNKPAAAVRMEEVLLKLPDGKLVSVRQLGELARVGINAMANCGRYIAKDLQVKQGTRKFYGNPKTIKAFKQAYQL